MEQILTSLTDLQTLHRMFPWEELDYALRNKHSPVRTIHPADSVTYVPTALVVKSAGVLKYGSIIFILALSQTSLLVLILLSRSIVAVDSFEKLVEIDNFGSLRWDGQTTTWFYASSMFVDERCTQSRFRRCHSGFDRGNISCQIRPGSCDVAYFKVRITSYW